MKRLVFDFDGTLYGEGPDNERWLDLYQMVKGLSPERLWLYSNGAKWQKLVDQTDIKLEHIQDFVRSPADLELTEAAISHALSNGFQGSPLNAALVKRAPEGAILVDDLAQTWIAVAGSDAEHTLTPEQFQLKVEQGTIKLIVDDDGYLAAC